MVFKWFQKKTGEEADTVVASGHGEEVVEASVAVDVEEVSSKSEQKGWLGKLRDGLGKSSSQLTEGVAGIFTKRKLDEDTLEELEDLLIMADLGFETTGEIIDAMRKERLDKAITPEEVRAYIGQKVEAILAPVAQPLVLDEGGLQVVLMCGVNGNGKTTTLGKLAKRYRDQGKNVLIAACDTFRAAAVEQLAVWAERAGCDIVKEETGADAASVAYKALKQAKAEEVDVLLIDTAGRLQNKANLMEELSKIVRVLHKIDEHVPQHILLVLDATTGQNAHSQVKQFKDIVGLTGLIVTKLDGTAKGGVVVSLAKAYQLPIHAVGVGEAIEDLQSFDAGEFARGLVSL